MNTSSGDYGHDICRLAHERAQTEALIRRRIEDARTAGHSWGEIGTWLGVSKQAASRRYGPKKAQTAEDPAQLTIEA